MSENTPGVNNTRNIEDFPDWFLVSLVNMANDGISMGITLQVDGATISGTMIGGAEYFEAFGASFASVIKEEEEAKRVRAAFAQHGTIYQNNGENKEPVDSDSIGFIHLKNARFYSGSNKPFPEEGTLWRGRLTKVSGFVLGSLTF